MRRKLVLIAAVVAATGLVIGSMSLTSAASSRRTGMEAWGRDALRRLDVQLPKPQSHEGGQTLVLISKSTRPPNEKGVDTGGPGPIGDYFMFRERLFDRTETRVGVIHGQCFRHFTRDTRTPRWSWCERPHVT